MIFRPKVFPGKTFGGIFYTENRTFFYDISMVHKFIPENSFLRPQSLSIPFEKTTFKTDEVSSAKLECVADYLLLTKKTKYSLRRTSMQHGNLDGELC
jgi:hypothetical protein